MPETLLAVLHGSAPELLIVALAAALAGFVDAIVGGGGLMLVPALFAWKGHVWWNLARLIAKTA
jgi:uncharacterized membrane protein YfcA